MKTKSNSTLQRLTKAELIEELRITEMNLESIEALYHQQIENVKDWSPVRHGHWIFDGLKTTRGNDYGKYTCSECGTDFPDARRHCAECGALMDGPLEHVEHEYYSSDKNKMHTWHGHG